MSERVHITETSNEAVRRKQRAAKSSHTTARRRPAAAADSDILVADTVMRLVQSTTSPGFPSHDHPGTSRVRRAPSRPASDAGSTAASPAARAPDRPGTGRVERGPSRLRTDATDAEHAKQMSANGGNPKSDPPRGRGGEVADEYEDDDDIDAVADAAIGQVKSKTMNVALGEYRAGQDRVHKRKRSQVAKRSREMAKLKGRLAIGASTAATSVERGGNEAKHGLLNAGRAVGRLLGMSVNPGTTVKKQTGANTTATANGAYGAVDTEFIEPEFTVELKDGTWHPIVTRLKGTYGKIYSPLPAGLSEVNGPDQNESRQQIKDLLALDGQDWYMTKAVNAHESVHEAHVHDALNNMGKTIAQMFATLTVDKSAAATKKDAIAAIKLLPGYNAIMNLANPNNSQIRQVWDNEYVNLITGDHDGPTQDAEADVVEPVIDKINSWRKKTKLKKIKKRWTCLNDSNAIQVPKGRKNP